MPPLPVADRERFVVLGGALLILILIPGWVIGTMAVAFMQVGQATGPISQALAIVSPWVQMAFAGWMMTWSIATWRQDRARWSRVHSRIEHTVVVTVIIQCVVGYLLGALEWPFLPGHELAVTIFLR